MFAFTYIISVMCHDVSLIIPPISHIMGMIILLGVFDLYKDRINIIIRILSIVFSCIVYCNFFIVILGLDSIIMQNDRYFVGGNYNQMSLPLFSAIVSNVLYCYISHKLNLNTILVMLLSVATTLFVGSMTATVGLILLILCSVVSFGRVSRIILPISFCVVIVFHIFVVGMNSDISSMKHITFFIEDILHKNLTFTNRDQAWVASVELFKEKPLLGYGHITVDWCENMFDGIATPHNMILLVLLTGGVALMMVMIFMGIVCVHESNRVKGYCTNFLQFAAVICLLMLAFEVYNWTLVFYYFVLMYYTPYFVEYREVSLIENVR